VLAFHEENRVGENGSTAARGKEEGGRWRHGERKGGTTTSQGEEDGGVKRAGGEGVGQQISWSPGTATVGAKMVRVGRGGRTSGRAGARADARKTSETTYRIFSPLHTLVLFGFGYSNRVRDRVSF
jgi:hypothetical protein